jgi:hypothetical protein
MFFKAAALVPRVKSSDFKLELKGRFCHGEQTKLRARRVDQGLGKRHARRCRGVSGLWGTLKEGFASSSAIAKAQLDPSTNELIEAEIADLETSEGRSAVQEALRREGYSGRHCEGLGHQCVVHSPLSKRRDIVVESVVLKRA